MVRGRETETETDKTEENAMQGMISEYTNRTFHSPVVDIQCSSIALPSIYTLATHYSHTK